MKTITTTCSYCKNSFEKEKKYYLRALKKKTQMFCTLTCANKARDTKQIISCSICKKEFFRRKKEIHPDKNYCSKSCSAVATNKQRIGEFHPNYKGTNYRKIALEHYGAECFNCKNTIVELLQVHHKDKNRDNNSLENLIVLCANCYILVHKKMVRII